MNRKYGWLVMIMALAATLSLTACAKPPQVEIDGAAAALAQAETAEAATYAATELEQAREAQRAATAEIEAQGQKFALLRSYDHALELLQKANEAAVAAEQAAVAGRAKAKADAEAAVVAIGEGLATVDADLAALAACRKKPKGFAQDLELLTGRAEALRGQVAEIQASIDAARFLPAIEMATALQAEITTLSTDLSGARTKLGC